MSELFLVRHGQASFGASDYDQLSPLGAKQGEALGRYWAAQGMVFDGVFMGPLKRHAQTLTAVSQTYPLASATCIPELAEHEAMEVFQHLVPQLAERGDKLGELVREMVRTGNGRLRLQAFVTFTRYWARGEVESGPYESWSAFRQRVASGIDKIIQQATSGQKLVTFTSGGVIAAATGYALDVGHERTMRLNAAVYNGSYTVYRFSQRDGEQQFSLSQFNAIPHLTKDLQTYI
ncbi:MAG: histidine phosphatase family protein [Chloroflexota bacterium]